MTIIPTTPPSLHVQTSAMMTTPLAPQQARTTRDRSNAAYDDCEDQMLIQLSDASLRVLALPTLLDDVRDPEEAHTLPFEPKTPAMRRKILPPPTDAADATQGIRLRPRALRRDDEQFLEDLFLLPALNDDDDMPDIASVTSSRSSDDDSSSGRGSVLGLPLTSSLSLLSPSHNSSLEESSATTTLPRSSSKTTKASSVPSLHPYEYRQQ